MLTERLKAAMSGAARLSPEAQEKVAAQIETVIADALWNADLNDPQNDDWLRQWIAEARQDDTVDFPQPRDARAMEESSQEEKVESPKGDA